MNISIKDTKIFNRMIDVFKALMADKYTPKWIKDKIQNLVLNELDEKNIENNMYTQSFYKLKHPVQAKTVNKIKVFVDGEGNEQAINNTNYLVTFYNGGTVELEEEIFLDMFELVPKSLK